jgi:hypothetical protein
MIIQKTKKKKFKKVFRPKILEVGIKTLKNLPLPLLNLNFHLNNLNKLSSIIPNVKP